MTITTRQHLLFTSLIILHSKCNNYLVYAQGGASAIPGFSISDFTSDFDTNPAVDTTEESAPSIAATEEEEEEEEWIPTCPAEHSGHVHSPDCTMYAM
jgi:hypothetical protein